MFSSAAKPLTFCEDFPRIAQRFEAWWLGEVLDRPVFLASANPNPSRPITRRLELLANPEAWYAAKLADLQQLHRVGDMLPSIRVDLGPVLLGSLLGGERVFGADTAWTERFINDEWSNADWTLHTCSPWWHRMVALTERVAAEAAGHYLVMSPGLGGTAEVLLNLRGATELSLDVVDRPTEIRAAVDAILPAWQAAFTELYRITSRYNAGMIHWLNLWSDRPYLVAECDFAYMISRRAFETLFLSDIVRQAAVAGRAVFHLDGPGATRHLDALLATPEIQAIQFSPGAGTPSALAWTEMFQKIQAARRSLLVICPADEVLTLCDSLRPEGLAIWVETPLPPSELDILFDRFCRQTGVASES